MAKNMNDKSVINVTPQTFKASCDIQNKAKSLNEDSDRNRKQTVVSLPQNSKGSDITADQTESMINMENFKIPQSQKCSMLEHENSGAMDSQADYAPVNIEHSNDEPNNEEEQPSEKKP